MATEDITLRILTETRKATQDMKKFSQKSSQEIEKVNDNLSSLRLASISVFSGLAVEGITAGFRAVGNAAQSLFNTFVVDGVAAAKVQEDAIQELNIALAASGKFSQEASQDFQEYASSLQQASRAGDEALLSAAALIQTLGQLEGEALKGATQAALDMSAALGVDLQTAANLVGRAATGEIGTLSRYGIVVKRGADNAETFANVLEKLNTQFGGAAAGQIKTFGGATDQLANTFGDLQEEVGFTITRSEAVINITNMLNKAFFELQEVVKNNRQEIRVFAINAFAALLEGAAKVVEGVGELILSYEKFKLFIPTLATVFRSVYQDVLDAQLTLLEALNFRGVFDENIASVKKFNEEFKKQTGLQEEEIGRQLNLAEQRKQSLDEVATKIRDFNVKVREEANNTADTQIEAQNRVLEKTIQTQEEIELARIEAEAKVIEKNEAEIEQRLKQIEAVDALNRDAEVSEQQARLNALNKLEKLEASSAEKQVLIQRRKEKLITKIQEEEDKARVANQRSTLSTIASLQNSNNKTLAAIGKAAALTQIAIAAPQGVSKALAAFPPPFNFVAAAAVGAAFAAQAAKVAGVPLQSGLTEVPRGFPNDTFPARLTSGERVVNVPQNRDLTDFLASQSNDSTSEVLGEKLDMIAGLLEENNERLDALELNTVVNIGNKEIINEVRDGLKAGRSLAV